MLRFFLLILLIENSIGVTTNELKDELRLVRQEIGLLKVENQNQSAQIALLQQVVELQNKTIDQKIDKEVRQRVKNCYGDGNFSKLTAQERQPFRMIPFQFDGGKNKNCRLLAKVSFDDVSDRSKSLGSSASDIAAPQKFYGQPTNCSDLFSMGYTLNGFYTVKPADHNNADDTKLETIFCAFQQPEGVAFNSSAIEKRIAHLNNLNDVAKASGSGIHFHGHRFQTKFSSVLIPQNSLLPFEIYLNMGGAFHENGTFIATKKGVYQFVFTMVMGSIPKDTNSTAVNLVLKNQTFKDGGIIGRSMTKEAGSSMAIGATWELNKGDQIYLKTKLGAGYEIEWASFSGSLLEEV